MRALKTPNDLEAVAEVETFKPVSNASQTDDVDPSEHGGDGVSIDDFYAFMPMHNYIFAPSRETWPASSVNALLFPVSLTNQDGSPKVDKDGKQVTLSASAWLDRNRHVEQMTWAPGEPMLIRDRLVSEGGWIDRQGMSVFNLYRPPSVERGDDAKAGPWLDHVRLVYSDSAERITQWLAHRVQRPGEKINHALVLGGAQGIGKDTLLEPIKHAIGHWNFSEVSPQHLMGRFNGFIKSVILRISEVRDLGETDRFSFYDRMKTYTAAPPDVLRCDEKNLREYSVSNVLGVIITSNHKSDGIFLPADDRRHYVAWSDKTKDDFTPAYWAKLWRWYERGGYGHVAAYLASLDLAAFDAKAPPPKTQAFWDIVDANRAPEDAELGDVLDKLQSPPAITLERIATSADESFATWLRDRRNRKQIPHRLEEAGYVRVHNAAAKDGLWKFAGRRQAIYARRDLPLRDQIAAASDLASR